jgi:hypothetical protein
MNVRNALRPTDKIDDEKDDEYCSKTDIHKSLRWTFRIFIGTQISQPVGTLPHSTLLLIGESWTHSLRQRDKWQLRSLQARISLERKERHDEEIPPQSFCGI